MAVNPHPTGVRLARFALNLDEIRSEGISLRLALADPEEANVLRNVCVNLAEGQDFIEDLLERRRSRASGSGVRASTEPR
jgi:hypothetical protein